MNVLLIGGGSNMMDAMIDKCKKSGHRVFLLTGGKGRHFSYKHVFEKYNFEYENEIIKDIFKSISPDITVFMGAYDTNFDWSEAREEIVRYTTGLMNILTAYSLMKKGRFVYFSSQEVYGEPHSKAICETEDLAPKGFKAMALAQGEEICSNYRRIQGLDMIILRFDHVYGLPEKRQREDSLCVRMCREALRSHHVSGNGKHVFSMLYLKDAVELAYKVIAAEMPKECCYHISSMQEISELQLAELICRKIDSPVGIIDNSVGENCKILLDGSRYKEEFGQKIFVNYEMGVEKLVRHLKRQGNSSAGADDPEETGYSRLAFYIRGIAAKLFPFVENMLIFILFFILNNRTVGSQYFDRLDFYLLYVLLFAVVHGQQQAIFSAILAAAGYFSGQMYERTGFDILMDFNTYVWIAQLFIVGMVVGYMRDQLKDIRNEDEEEIRYLKRKMDDISDINDSNIQMKRNFERQVVNQRDSMGKIYELTSSLERYAPEEVLFYAAKILSQLMDSRSVAVYAVANEDYARLFSATSPEARELGKSIKYSAMDELFSELKEHHVYINRTMKEDFPLMASAVYEQEKMRFIVMIWDIPWQRMTLAEANRLTIVCALIRDAAMRAEQYLGAVKSRRYIQGTDILNKEAFEMLVKAFLDARAQGLTECEILSLSVKKKAREDIAGKLKHILRQTDYIGIRKGGEMQILLPNTDKEGAEIVEKRLKEVGISAVREGGFHGR